MAVTVTWPLTVTTPTMLLATLSMLALHSAAVPPGCGCAPYADAAIAAPPATSAQARAIRDFSLFVHRKLADDLVRGEGLYLDNLLALLNGCPERAKKINWLRQVAISTADTDQFADRIARSYEAANSCADQAPADPRP